MRRVIAVVGMVVMMALGATAQNANRSGFFAEVGAGVFTGKTPRTSIGRTMDDQFVYTLAKGCALDLSIGYRLRIADHWAYEWRFGLEASAKEFNPLFNPKLFPVGFRYTSPEIFGNSSLYAHVNLGVSSCPKGRIYTIGGYGSSGGIATSWYSDAIEPGHSKILSASCNYSWGIVSSVGAGLNLTTNVYVGVVYDSLKMVNCIYTNGPIFKYPYFGSAGIRLGYRF